MSYETLIDFADIVDMLLKSIGYGLFFGVATGILYNSIRKLR